MKLRAAMMCKALSAPPPQEEKLKALKMTYVTLEMHILAGCVHSTLQVVGSEALPRSCRLVNPETVRFVSSSCVPDRKMRVVLELLK